MGSVRAGTGLISGINFTQIVDQVSALQRAPIERLEERLSGFGQVQTGIKALEANLLSLTTAAQGLSSKSNYSSFKLANSDKSQIVVTSTENAIPGTYRFQALQEATTFQSLTRGFVNADQQAIGPGTLTIATGGELHQETLLDAFNGGNGVGRGTIRITDRTGNSAEIDLTEVYSVDDVLEAINSNNAISVTATAQGDHLVIEDSSGGSASNLIIEDLNNGTTAADLGVAQSVAADVISGSAVYSITGDFTLDQINDGNGLHLLKGAPDVRFTLSDDTVIEVNFDDAATLNGLVDAINNHADNAGKLSAALVDGQLELTDASGGGGAGVFSAENINGASVVSQLGLDTAASGNKITGQKLAAGINSVLLSNLRGGQGIDVLGSISLTDRSGAVATVDLSTASSLDEVLETINAATDSSTSQKLQLTARINTLGTGIEIVDTSGAAASNLIIADVETGTAATQLGIAIDAAQNSIDSNNLGHRYLNEASSIAKYASDGNVISPGSLVIIDSTGKESVVEISSAVKTIGDIIQRINVTSGISVRAELNETGDGFVLIDEAGGAGALKVEEFAGGTTAADLRLLGEGVPGGDGKSRISSRAAAVIEITDTDTLDDVVQKINDATGFVNATVFNDGSAFNAHRLSLTSTDSGKAGQLILDDGGLGFNFNTVSEGQNALLRVGNSPETGFLVTSNDNNFDNIVTGLDVTVLKVGTGPADVTVSRDFTKIEKAIQTFVKSYNAFASTSRDLTKFNSETGERGVLQGKGIVYRVQNRMNSLINNKGPASTGSVRSLVELGVRFTSTGKLTFDESRLAKKLEENPQAVTDFFLTTTDGFADRTESVLETLTDSTTGTLTYENNSIQDSMDALFKRIGEMDILLQSKRERMLRQYIRMEEILGALTFQQNAISAISPIRVNPAGKGIL